jgi:hypothetical protein
LPIVEPADGGDELCSVAPPEVSALPDCGMVADLDASGDVVFAVGGFVGWDEFSVAKAGTNPMALWRYDGRPKGAEALAPYSGLLGTAQDHPPGPFLLCR